jgi:hypothetical protein
VEPSVTVPLIFPVVPARREGERKRMTRRKRKRKSVPAIARRWLNRHPLEK